MAKPYPTWRLDVRQYKEKGKKGRLSTINRNLYMGGKKMIKSRYSLHKGIKCPRGENQALSEMGGRRRCHEVLVFRTHVRTGEKEGPSREREEEKNPGSAEARNPEFYRQACSITKHHQKNVKRKKRPF